MENDLARHTQIIQKAHKNDFSHNNTPSILLVTWPATGLKQAELEGLGSNPQTAHEAK